MKVNVKELLEQHKQELLKDEYLKLEIIIPEFTGKNTVIPYVHVNSTFSDDKLEYGYTILYDLLNTIRDDIEDNYPNAASLANEFVSTINKKIEIEEDEI